MAIWNARASMTARGPAILACLHCGDLVAVTQAGLCLQCYEVFLYELDFAEDEEDEND
jgi:hypothetical protein